MKDLYATHIYRSGKTEEKVVAVRIPPHTTMEARKQIAFVDPKYISASNGCWLVIFDNKVIRMAPGAAQKHLTPIEAAPTAPRCRTCGVVLDGRAQCFSCSTTTGDLDQSVLMQNLGEFVLEANRQEMRANEAESSARTWQRNCEAATARERQLRKALESVVNSCSPWVYDHQSLAALDLQRARAVLAETEAATGADAAAEAECAECERLREELRIMELRSRSAEACAKLGPAEPWPPWFLAEHDQQKARAEAAERELDGQRRRAERAERENNRLRCVVAARQRSLESAVTESREILSKPPEERTDDE